MAVFCRLLWGLSTGTRQHMLNEEIWSTPPALCKAKVGFNLPLLHPTKTRNMLSVGNQSSTSPDPYTPFISYSGLAEPLSARSRVFNENCLNGVSDAFNLRSDKKSLKLVNRPSSMLTRGDATAGLISESSQCHTSASAPKFWHVANQ